MLEQQHIIKKEYLKTQIGRTLEAIQISQEKMNEWSRTWCKNFEKINYNKLSELFEENKIEYFYYSCENPVLIWATLNSVSGFTKSENKCFSMPKQDFTIFKDNIFLLKENFIWKKIGF